MIRTLATIDSAALDRFDAIIDVRSPGEFALDHVPGAINLPVLDDAQRAEVGTIYVRQDRHLARRIGAAHVARNIAAHLEGPLADRPPGFQPLIYCWRGGQRSQAMATILSQVGWPVTLLQGGYQTWRRHVQGRLYDQPLGLDLVLLDGGTGVAKTDILNRAGALGVQTLDLEGLADHRGSLLGGRGRPQPDQKGFETALLMRIDALDPVRPVLVEAESSRIGRLALPPALWTAMGDAPRIVLEAPIAARADYLVTAYADIAADRPRLLDALDRLPARIGKARLAEFKAMAQSGALRALAEALMEHHYDRAYRGSSRSDDRVVLETLSLDGLDPADQDRAADAIKALMPGS